MATRSNIAYLMPNGHIQVIYCHEDGYPKGVGKMLNTHYKHCDRVRELMALGDLHCLQRYLYPGGPHSYDQRQPNVTVAFGRDRGDEATEAVEYNSILEWKAHLSPDIEYCYLFQPSIIGGTGKWQQINHPVLWHNKHHEAVLRAS